MKLFLLGIGALMLSMPFVAGSRMIVPPLSDNIAAPMLQPEEKTAAKPKTVPELIRHYSLKYSVDEKLAIAIATCESGMDPNAKNKTSTAGGVYQFLDSGWKSNSKFYLGHVANKFNAEANVHVAIAKIKREGTRARSESRHCWKSKL